MSKKVLIGLAVAAAIVGVLVFVSRRKTEIVGGGAPTPAVTLPRPENPRVGSPSTHPADALANTIATYQAKVCPPQVPPEVCKQLANAQQQGSLFVAKGIASGIDKVKSWF